MHHFRRWDFLRFLIGVPLPFERFLMPYSKTIVPRICSHFNPRIAYERSVSSCTLSGGVAGEMFSEADGLPPCNSHLIGEKL